MECVWKGHFLLVTFSNILNRSNRKKITPLSWSIFRFQLPIWLMGVSQRAQHYHLGTRSPSFQLEPKAEEVQMSILTGTQCLQPSCNPAFCCYVGMRFHFSPEPVETREDTCQVSHCHVSLSKLFRSGLASAGDNSWSNVSSITPNLQNWPLNPNFIDTNLQRRKLKAVLMVQSMPHCNLCLAKNYSDLHWVFICCKS